MADFKVLMGCQWMWVGKRFPVAHIIQYFQHIDTINVYNFMSINNTKISKR